MLSVKISFSKLLLFVLFAVFFFSCGHSNKNYSTDQNVLETNRQSIRCNDPLRDYFHTDEQQRERFYSLMIAELIDKYQKSGSLQAVDIENIIPKTKSEFSTYYKGYQNEKEVMGRETFYHYCDSLSSLYAIRDSLNVFYAYLNLYQIMDCQIANESYCTNVFNKIEDAIYANKQKFDKLYQSFDEGLKNKYACFKWE
mgnify:CR=1 FL=1